jgi:NitT/TauT family transport system substrate-binding protein
MNRQKVISSLFAILVCVVLITSCSPGEKTPTPPPLEPVSLQLQWVTQAQFAGYYVALDKGWYREQGIDLVIKPGGPDLVPVDLVSVGTHDFGTALLADLAVAVQGGKPVISLAQIQQMNGLLLVAFKSSGIEQPKDFVGKRVGVWLGGWEAQFNALMAKEGLTAGQDFELVSQGFSMDPFLAGQLDVASAMIYNEYHVVLESGVAAGDLNIIDYADYGLDFPGDVLFTSRQLVEQNPDLCVRMLRATLQLSMMSEIAKLVSLPMRPLGYTDRDNVRRTIDTLLSYDVLAGPVLPEDVFTNEIWEQASAD